MAKTGTAKATRAPKIPTVATVVQPADIVNLQEVFKVTSETSEAEILRVDGMVGTRLEFDFVYFKKLPESFVATLKAHNQKAYWLGFSEFESRDRRANLALHSIGGGVDPLSKILDRPRGRNNPITRDTEIIQKRLPGYYVTTRIQGGEGDYMTALEAGFKVIRRPIDKEEEASKEPFDWSGEIWKIPDGTSDPTSGEVLYNVFVAIRKQVWDDNLKAQSMASHNAYSQNKQQFIEGSENISRDMLGGKEKVIISDLDEVRQEEYYEHGGKRA